MFHLSYISSLPVSCFACGTGIFFVNQQKESFVTVKNIISTGLNNQFLDNFVWSKAASISYDSRYWDVSPRFTHVLGIHGMIPIEKRTVVRFYKDEDIEELVDWTRKNFAFDVWFDPTIEVPTTTDDLENYKPFYTGACKDADVHQCMIKYAFKAEYIRISIIEDNTIHHLLVWAMGNRPSSKRVS